MNFTVEIYYDGFGKTTYYYRDMYGNFSYTGYTLNF